MTHTPIFDDSAAREQLDARMRDEPSTPLRIAIRVPGSPTCVAIVDLPEPTPLRGPCNCGGCHAALVDRAADYL